MIKDTVRKLTSDFDEVSFSDEEGMILGSAGGLKQAESLFASQSDLLLMNGDEVFFPRNPNILCDLIQKRRATSALSTLIVQEHPLVGSKFGGVWIDSLGNVVGFGKTAPTGRSNPDKSDLRGVHFVGYQALSADIFGMIPAGEESNIFYDILVGAIAQGHTVNTLFDQGHWTEMGNSSDFLGASRELLRARAHGQFCNGSSAKVSEVLNWGWESYDPSDFQTRDLGSAEEVIAVVSRKSKIPKGARLQGSVVIGKGFEATGFSELRDSVYAGKLSALSANELSNAFVVGDYAF